jgi:hypothetical protein
MVPSIIEHHNPLAIVFLGKPVQDGTHNCFRVLSLRSNAHAVAPYWGKQGPGHATVNSGDRRRSDFSIPGSVRGKLEADGFEARLDCGNIVRVNPENTFSEVQLLMHIF